MPPTTTATPNQPGVTPPPHQQLSAALIAAPPDRPSKIELILQPAELGALRFDMQPEGDKLHILISAERPETLDLLRRTAPELMAELRQSGLQGGTLNFGQWSTPRDQTANSAPRHMGPLDEPPAKLPPPQRRTPSAGLDLRV